MLRRLTISLLALVFALLCHSPSYATMEPVVTEIGAQSTINYSFDMQKRAVVLVDKAAFRTYILQIQEDNQPHVVYSAPNAHGKVDTPTPTGRFTVERVVLDPYWRNRWTGALIAPYSRDHRNPMGVAAIPITADVGLHGTNNPDAIGTRISSGCIRHYNGDISRMATMVFTGTAVYIEDRVDASTMVDRADFRWENLPGVRIEERMTGENQDTLSLD